MKKKVVAFAVFASLSMVSSSVFADSTNGSAVTNSSTVITSDASTTGGPATPTAAPFTVSVPKTGKAVNPQVQAIKQIYAQIVQLRQQDKQIDAQLKDQTAKNESLLKGLSGARKDDNTSIKVKLQSLAQQGKSIRDDLKAQHDLAKAAKKGKDKVALAAITNKIKEDNTRLNALRIQYKQVLASRKDRVSDNKQSFGSVHTLWAQEKTQWASIKPLEVQKKAQWDTFRQAMKGKNYAAAANALEQIVELKQQILMTKQQILATKQSVTAALNVIISGSNTPDPAPTPVSQPTTADSLSVHL
ncbi:hypothetical protein PP175_23605 [Aneurinibacillus sp. Ricciae_BoGa-3]|uniref:hypothetical protein n=1 Tax=Aneurinibacillus sp. Ricciae_BoGa-3 TaxID=3022697 RepID=UPI002340CD13|nr:hypothetical protein [Aneurinibacillus sp. Ricciae_BoGa-3]WCK54239.1 hypothetical protein PP175_23605 [Aneurinibacillus sp. Ricciae_BoGa-3]